MKRLHLNPDAAEGTIVDPLDTNVNEIDTSYPLLRKGTYDFRLEVTKERNKAGDGDNLVVAHSTTTPNPNNKPGEPEIPAGLKITSYISLTERPERTENGKTKRAYTLQDIAKSIAEIGQAAGINATPREIINNPATLNGKVVRADVVIAPATGEYKESNRISKYHKMA